MSKESKEVAVKEKQELQTSAGNPFGVMERPAVLEGDRRGTEDLDVATDIKPPALRLAQGQSPQVKRSNEKYIEGLREGEFFNSLTQKIYGEGPLFLIVIKALGHRNVELLPLEQGGGVLDFDVPDNDPRAQFTTEIKEGKKVRKKPIATRFYDYIVMLLHENGQHETMSMSLKGGQIAKAVNLNTLVVGGNLPAFAYLWKLEAKAESKNNFDFQGWKFTPAGYPAPELLDKAESQYELLKGKTVELDRTGEEIPEDTDDDDVKF